MGLVVTVAGGVWGLGLFGSVVGGGFEDPGSESAKAAERIVAEVGRQDADLVVIYSSDSAEVTDAAFRDAVTGTVGKLRQHADVAGAVSFYDTQSPAFVSHDRHATFVAVTLKKAESTEQYDAVKPLLDAPGLRTQVAGGTAIQADITERISADIARAETMSMPVLIVLLLFVFGGAVAAGMPMLVGGIAVLLAFAATRALTYVTDISVFSINIITMLGMGLAIDYALFIVSRFREELAGGRSTAEAVERTLDTAGRTVFVSAVTVAVALASLLLFPQVFLRSMGLGGVSAVLVAMLASVTVLPALLAVLGPRINALKVRLPRRSAPASTGLWERLARAVMRRPLPVIAGTLAILTLLALPFAGAQFGGPDERVLPEGEASRVATERLASDFPPGAGNTVKVLVTGVDGAAAGGFAESVKGLDGVTGVQITAAEGTSTVLAVAYDGSSASERARDIVAGVRDLPAPAGGEVLVGGATAELVDLLDSLTERLPWMALLVAGTTFLLLFLAFGSLVLPIKAIVMNVVSIGASFGAVVWVFQDGHLSDFLGFTPTGDLEATQLILMLAILFGLSTDYEVFLLSRVREEWDRTHDNVQAVAGGLQRTGRIITSAALLLVIVIGGFATGGISFIKMIGVGMIVAIVVDATLVRALLVPATMRLLGRANWWLPGPLDRFYKRYGIHEEPPAPATEPARVPVAV
ncbi:MMPL family transporter [Virgisporangium aliadipatigenens]|uniref:MMPL family transporter n=1 Tax=Virgisporangium aliadipatigenens TaxID=741659 RepID=UPI001EF3AB0B|nr:MMPL family transporter [Virgisporangium aliadipatigenens]